MVARVLSGNRNFEARVHQDVKANYLASPPLVVAYALAGTVDIDLDTEPLGTTKDGRTVYLKDIWPSAKEVEDAVRQFVDPRPVREGIRRCLQGLGRLAGDRDRRRRDVLVGREVDLHPGAAVLRRDEEGSRARSSRSKGARCLAKLGDSVTTDHISPAGDIKKDGPAGKFLVEHGVAPAMFNSYGSRRGNDRVMTRGTFANIRIKNELAPGTKAASRRDFTDGAVKSIYDASVNYKAKNIPLDRPRRQGLRHGFVARLGREGHLPPRREGRHRRELRAHPPLEPRRHGRAAAHLPARARAATRSA